jgi:hypothetical protein
VATFLQLCQRVARDSGTVSGDRPTTVVAQTGRLGDIVRWTNDAWNDIQRSRREWRWMRTEFSGSLANGTQRYTSTALGIATRFGDWVCEGEDEARWSLYLTATGVSDEGPLAFLDWDTFYRTQLRGTPPTSSKPRFFSIDDAKQLVFSPIPDAIYTLRGLYKKSAQTLSVDADTPEMPEDFHRLIVFEALKKLGTFDENSVQQRAEWANEARLIKFDLELEQLPMIGPACDPIA